MKTNRFFLVYRSIFPVYRSFFWFLILRNFSKIQKIKFYLTRKPINRWSRSRSILLVFVSKLMPGQRYHASVSYSFHIPPHRCCKSVVLPIATLSFPCFVVVMLSSIYHKSWFFIVKVDSERCEGSTHKETCDDNLIREVSRAQYDSRSSLISHRGILGKYYHPKLRFYTQTQVGILRLQLAYLLLTWWIYHSIKVICFDKKIIFTK